MKGTMTADSGNHAILLRDLPGQEKAEVLLLPDSVTILLSSWQHPDILERAIYYKTREKAQFFVEDTKHEQLRY